MLLTLNFSEFVESLKKKKKGAYLSKTPTCFFQWYYLV